MYEYIFVGSSPCMEECAQLGQDNYDKQSKLECKLYKEQLWRITKEKFNITQGSLDGFDIVIKNEYHDFGTYREVALKFDYNNDVATNLAYNIEGITPEYWDDIALTELKNNNQVGG